MEKPTCGIIEDLLQSYCDDITGETVTEMIQEHLKECSECQKKYEGVLAQRQREEEAEVLRGKSFGQKLKSIRDYMIGIAIGFLLPIASVVIWLLISFIRSYYETLNYFY